MGRSNIAVDSGRARELAERAKVQRRTLFGLTNEIVESALRVLDSGGSIGELYPSWWAARLLREIGGFPAMPRGLIDELVERLAATDREWLLSRWFENGQRLGERLRIVLPRLDDLATAVQEFQGVLPAQRLEVRRVPADEWGRDRLAVRIVSDHSQTLTDCLERLVAGVLSCYAFRAEESHAGPGILEVTAIQEVPAHAEAP